MSSRYLVESMRHRVATLWSRYEFFDFLGREAKRQPYRGWGTPYSSDGTHVYIDCISHTHRPQNSNARPATPSP